MGYGYCLSEVSVRAVIRPAYSGHLRFGLSKEIKRTENMTDVDCVQLMFVRAFIIMTQ